MGIPEKGLSTLPDTYGLPEYFISEVATEIDGPNVRMVCGTRRAGQIHWMFSCVMRADLLVVESQQVQSAALEAFNLTQLVDRRRSGH